ncbi:MAG: hypothetical protein RR821_01705 [Clostridia bacterium]
MTPTKSTSKRFLWATMDRITTVMDELSCKMRTLSVPWEASGRYWGHMLSQQLMPAELAYTFAMLWNSNTCTYEASPATSLMEGEVGQQLCRLMGWKNGWGHLSACGTIANLEAMWLMRNLKSVPLAVKKVCPELVEGMEDWALLNLSVDDIVALMKKTGDKFDQVKAHTARNGHNIGKHEVSFQIITEPNFNIVDYIIKEEGCHDLAYHNKLNRLFYAYACYEKGGTYNNEFIVSHSDFTTTDYGNSPFDFVKRMGFDWGQWQHTEKLTVLRSCCMSPYMCDADTFADAAKRIDGAIQAKLVQVYAELDSPSVP